MKLTQQSTKDFTLIPWTNKSVTRYNKHNWSLKTTQEDIAA